MSSDPLAGCDGYRLVRPLAGPAMLESFIAEDTTRSEEVLLRLLPAGALDDAEAVTELRDRAAALQALGHPNIARVLDVGKTASGRAYVATELAGGRPLREEIEAADGHPPVLWVLDLTCGALGALEAAHDEGIVHGSLALESFCLCAAAPAGSSSSKKRKRMLRVMDFGLATALEDAGVKLDECATSAAAVSSVPPTDPRHDVFCAGAALYELLAGQSPFESPGGSGGRRARAHASIEPPSHHSPSHDMGPELDAVILRSLELDPDDRYQTLEAFRVGLERVASLMRQVSLPGNLQRSDEGYSVEIPRPSDEDPWSEDPSDPLVFSHSPDSGEEPGALSNPPSGSTENNTAGSVGTWSRPTTLVVVVAVAAIAAVVAYLVP